MLGGLVDLLEELLDLRPLEAAVAAEGADGRDLAGACPAGDRLGVDPEHRRHLGGGEELLGLVGVVVGRLLGHRGDLVISSAIGPDRGAPPTSGADGICRAVLPVREDYQAFVRFAGDPGPGA